MEKKDYFLYKYRDLKTRQPGALVSGGVHLFLRFLGAILILLSAMGIMLSLLAARDQYLYMVDIEHIPDLDKKMVQVAEIIGFRNAEIVKEMLLRPGGMFALLIILACTCFIVLVLSILLVAVGRQVIRRNNYIAEIDKVTKEMLEENLKVE